MKKFILILMTTLMVSGLQAQTIKETIRGKNGELQGTAVTTVRGNKSVTVYIRTNMVRLPEDLRVLQIPRERPIRYIVTNMVKEQEPPQPALKIQERLLLQLRSIVINTGSVRVQVPLGKLAIPPLQPIRISMEESKSEETVRGSSFHE